MIIYLILPLAMCNWVGFMSSRVLMSLYAIQLDASQAAIGVLIALFGLGPVLLSVISGRVCDRVGTHWPILLGTAGMTVGYLIPWQFGGIEVLYLSATISGTGLVFSNIALQNLVASLGEGDQRTRNVSLQSLCVALSSLIGPLLVGISIDHRGHVPTFLYITLLTGSSCLAWVAARRIIPHPRRKPKAEATSRVRDLLKIPALRRIVIMSGLLVAGVDLYNFYLPIYGHSIGLSATMIGVILGAFAAAAILVRFFLPHLTKWLGDERVMTSSMLLAGLLFLFFPFVDQVVYLLLISFGLGLVLGVGQPLSLVMTYNRAPAGRTGEALGMRFTFVNLTHMVIPMAAGTIGAALGVITVFFANSVLMLGGSYLHHRETAKKK